MKIARRLISPPSKIKYLVFSIFAANLTISLTAQNATKWYWAFIEHDHQVIAYNITGEFRVLLDHVRPSSLYRIDDHTAVIIIEDNGKFGAYILTSENAYLVSTLHTAEYPDNYSPPSVKALALSFPYILIWNHDFTAPLLFNRETHSVETLNLDAWETIRLSDHGRYLRYWVMEDVEHERKLHWRLMEYDVLNTTTRIIFERDVQIDSKVASMSEHCEPDSHGEKWFCVQSITPHNASAPLIQNEIIHLDGKIESIDADQHLKVGLNSDWFFVSSELYLNACDATCTFEVTEYATGEIQRYDLSSAHIPDDVTFALNYSRILDARHVLLFDVNSEATLYLLEKNKTLRYLGIIPCCHFHSGSSDGRWIILFDSRDKDELSTILVDVQLGRVVVRVQGLIDLIGFAPGGAYLGGTTFYSFANDLVFNVDEGLYPGRVIDVLPSGIALGAWAYGSESTPDGIYVTDVSQGRRLLIRDAQPFYSPSDLSLQ